jgi:hypothetical protein
MENRKSKTVTMLRNKVEWKDVVDVLGITKPTLMSWRNSGDPNKNQVIDEAVKEVVKASKV